MIVIATLLAASAGVLGLLLLAMFYEWPPRKDISGQHGVYLTRWHLLRCRGYALMLHKMHRPDADRCLHDHPWWFLTLVLRGGYEEVYWRPSINDNDVRYNRPGMVRFNRAMHTHRIARLPKGSCWTLVLRGPVMREWGFRNGRGQWLSWRLFVDWAGTALWCKED